MSIKTPKEVVEATLEIGVNKIKATENIPRLLTLSVMAGAYVSLGGILSVIVGFGFPELTAGNPALQRFLSGSVFPVGLILIVLLGTELFTGNNALLVPAFMHGRYTIWDVLKNWGIVYVGNFAGCLLFSYFMVYLVGLTAPDPWHSAIINVSEAKVAMPWMVILLKGIGANWCVCLAIWLALTGHGLLEKMVGAWLPVMAFATLGYEHSIANMFFISTGMMEGADVTVGQFLFDNLLPATIGNIIGGAIFVGCIHTRLHLKSKKS